MVQLSDCATAAPRKPSRNVLSVEPSHDAVSAAHGPGRCPDGLHTGATLTMEQVPGGWKIAAVHLSLRAKVPGLDAVKFKELAESAKANCPVSKVLNAAITLDAALE
jgi:organic hydroperoxide reductase OsmC/OhrA